MDSKIVTKFTIATEQGIGTLLYLTQTIAREKFLPLLPKEQVENYLAEYFNEKVLMVEVNSMSNQWLVVYINDQPAGFARITSKGERPATLSQRRAIRIADFGILNKYPEAAIRQSLFDKCLSVCKPYEATWINEYTQNPFIDFFESAAFTKQEEVTNYYELPLPSLFLIKES